MNPFKTPKFLLSLICCLLVFSTGCSSTNDPPPQSHPLAGVYTLQNGTGNGPAEVRLENPGQHASYALVIGESRIISEFEDSGQLFNEHGCLTGGYTDVTFSRSASTWTLSALRNRNGQCEGPPEEVEWILGQYVKK